MKEIAIFEQAIENGCDNQVAAGIHPTTFWAYRTSKEAGNECIDFHEIIWECDIEPIVACFDEYNVKEFTISCNFSGLISTLSKLALRGWKVDGIKYVYAPYKNFLTGDHELIPAVKMVLQ